MKTKTSTYLGIVIIILLIVTTTVGFVSNSKNKRNYNEEKLQNESISSQKVQVSQELDKVKSDLTTLTMNKESVEKSLAETNAKLTETEKRINSLSKENSLLQKDRIELANLQKSKNELDKVYEDLKLKQETAKSRISELENSAILLDAQKKELTGKLENAEKFRSDNIEIYGSTGNKRDRLTYLARRTKKLNISFDVPQNLTEAISIKIITPSGTIITPDNKSLTRLNLPESGNFTAGLSSIPGELDASRKLALTYTAKEKLIPGEYKIEIFTKEINIGNCRLKLR